MFSFFNLASETNPAFLAPQQPERMDQNPNRAEAERLLGIAEKLLQSRDFNGSKEFAILAQENEPLLDGSDQILAVADVILAAEKLVNNNHDWYAILQVDRRCEDHDLIKKQYRKLALLLHPDKNRYPFADQAFKLVAEAWAVLSDARRKMPYDHELNLFTKVDLTAPDLSQQGNKLPVRRGFQRPTNTRRNNTPENSNSSNINFSSSSNNNDNNNRNDGDERTRVSTFWTSCPYCYILYEFPRVYEDCCLRCPGCKRGFHGTAIPDLPPQVPGKDEYYCCWGFFPMGFAVAGSKERGAGPTHAEVTPARNAGGNVGGGGNFGVVVGLKAGNDGGGSATAPSGTGTRARSQGSGVGPRKRGRPRKNPL